ncbi:MAG TPA: EAL domain-containing protein [Polyangia bacterium]|nr:EAL domain-containing protein [Polyangia bacterium]
MDLVERSQPPADNPEGYVAAIGEIVAREQITSHFQPILDLHHGTVMAWEVLSRGPEPFASPSDLFAAAERIGLGPTLEYVCRHVALRTIAGFPSSIRSRSFFINVSPNTIGDPRLGNGYMQAELAELGLDQRNFVIEITERESIGDYAAFERQIRHYVEHGFRIALDDLGAGHSGLVTLVTCSPHFMKLDMTLSRDIHRHSYKQHLVKSLIAFAASVDAALIAEGVETWEELETLARLGVRYAQGYLFARPSRTPSEAPAEILAELRRIMRQFNYRESDLN